VPGEKAQGYSAMPTAKERSLWEGRATPRNRFHLFFEHQGFLFFFLALAHRAFAAFVASFFLSSGLSAAMRFLPLLPPAALPPFLPISRITSEIRFRRIALSYEERPDNGQSAT
jgi:hypothetical protein